MNPNKPNPTITPSTVITGCTSPYASRWWVDDQPGTDETPGIRIRCSYTDPKFTFGNAAPMEMTFSYLVKGIGDNQLLLELPRDINRRKLIALMQLKP